MCPLGTEKGSTLKEIICPKSGANAPFLRRLLFRKDKKNNVTKLPALKMYPFDNRKFSLWTINGLRHTKKRLQICAKCTDVDHLAHEHSPIRRLLYIDTFCSIQ